jgi:hypothetical protein
MRWICVLFFIGRLSLRSLFAGYEYEPGLQRCQRPRAQTGWVFVPKGRPNGRTGRTADTYGFGLDGLGSRAWRHGSRSSLG